MCYFISLGIVATSFSQKWLAIIVKIQSDFLSAEELLFDAIDKQRLRRWSSYGLIAAFSNAIDLVYRDNYRNIIKCQGRGCFCFGVFILREEILCPTDKIKSQRQSYLWISVFCRILSESHHYCVLELFDLFPPKFHTFPHFTIPAKDCTHLFRIIQTKEPSRMRP